MKKILAIVLIVVTLCCLTACESYDEGVKNVTKDVIINMGFIPIENIFVSGDNCAYLVYDPDTKVEYIFYDGYRSFSICPYYDKNGSVKFYEGT